MYLTYFLLDLYEYSMVISFFIRDAFQKKVHMEGLCPNLSLPPPPFKSRELNRKDIFIALDPPHPLKN